MKLYTGKIATIAEEMIHTLTADGDIEVGDAREAQLDIEAILKEYVRLDRELTDKTKDLMEQRNLPYGQFGKLKRAMELANKTGARHVLIVGDEEMAAGRYALKNMSTGEQESLTRDEIAVRLAPASN